MKYIDAGRLKAEIEKRMHICDGIFERDSNTYYQGKAVAYQETLPLIDSLQQEQPEVDLEEEVKRYYSDNFAYISSDQPTLSILTNIARHFTEWQKEQMMKEAVEGEIQMRYSGCLCAKTIRSINEDKFKFGDKVRIIVVKEEK